MGILYTVVIEENRTIESAAVKPYSHNGQTLYRYTYNGETRAGFGTLEAALNAASRDIRRRLTELIAAERERIAQQNAKAEA